MCSVPAAADAVPGDVARQPLGVDRSTSSRSTFFAPHLGHGGAGLSERRQVLLEPLVARLAPVLVDRHRATSLASLDALRAARARARASTPTDADLEAVLGFLDVILPALDGARGSELAAGGTASPMSARAARRAASGRGALAARGGRVVPGPDRGRRRRSTRSSRVRAEEALAEAEAPRPARSRACRSRSRT